MREADPMPRLTPSLRVSLRALGIDFVDGLKVQGLYHMKRPRGGDQVCPGACRSWELFARAPSRSTLPLQRKQYESYRMALPRRLGLVLRRYLTAHYALTERASYKLANRCSTRAQPEASEPPRYIWGRYSVGASLRPPRPKRNENFALDRLHAIEFRKRLS